MFYYAIETEILKHQVKFTSPELENMALTNAPPRYRGLLKQLSTKYKVPLAVVVPLIQTESEWREDAVGFNSGSFDLGLGQINSRNFHTFEQYFPGYTVYNPRHNLEMSVWFLSNMYARFGSWYDVLCAYNAGPNSVDSGSIPTSTKKYAAKIITYRFRGFRTAPF